MFDHDTDQSLLLIGTRPGVLFALPFVTAWLEANAAGPFTAPLVEVSAVGDRLGGGQAGRS